MKKTGLKDKNIILGITGSIAAYKSCDLVRNMKKAGANVSVIMTDNAKEFVTETTLSVLSGRPVYSEMFFSPSDYDIAHISLAEWADVLLVAPATANIIGKFASGIADDLLSCLFLSLSPKTPVIIAPAMNEKMYLNPVVEKNIEYLKKIGVNFAGPQKGDLACGEKGIGRMSDVSDIIDALLKII